MLGLRPRGIGMEELQSDKPQEGLSSKIKIILRENQENKTVSELWLF
jgi:hypothetical protein